MARVLSKKLLLLAIATVILVNTVILAQVLLNRSSVTYQLTLSERELKPPYYHGFNKENSGLQLALQWSTPLLANQDEWQFLYSHPQRSLSLSQMHYASFGFAPCDDDYRRQRTSAWVLVEFAGPHFRQHMLAAEQSHAMIIADIMASKKALSAPVSPQHEVETLQQLTDKQARADKLLSEVQTGFTRLLVIDAAASADLLQQRIAESTAQNKDTLLILPAEVQPSYQVCHDSGSNQDRMIYINRLATSRIHVPKSFAEQLPPQLENGEQPHFTATLHYGKFFIPWLSQLQLTPAANAAQG